MIALAFTNSPGDGCRSLSDASPSQAVSTDGRTESLARMATRAIAAAWIARAVAIVLNLVLVPVLFRFLPVRELGLWFLLGQSGAFLALMDLGLTATVTRHIALARGRASIVSGKDEAAFSAVAIGKLLRTSVVLSRGLAIGSFVLVWAVGWFALPELVDASALQAELLLAWTLVAVGNSCLVWAGPWSAFLLGVGDVRAEIGIRAGLRALALVAQVAVAVGGGGIGRLAVVTLLSGLALRICLCAAARRRHGALSRPGEYCSAVFRSLLGPSLKAWLTALGGFLILKTDQYFIAYFRDPRDIPAYHAAYTVLASLTLFAVALGTASHTFVSQLWRAGDRAAVHKMVSRTSVLGLLVMGCGSACVLVSGESLFRLWLGPGSYVGAAVVLMFCVTFTLEAHHVVVSVASRATEDEAFAAWALGAGALNLLLTWALIEPFGLLGVAAGTMIAQMCTNNWFAVYRGLRRLKMGIRQHVFRIVLPAAGVSALAWGAAWSATQMLAGAGGDLGRVTVSFVITATVLGVGAYLLVARPSGVAAAPQEPSGAELKRQE